MARRFGNLNWWVTRGEKAMSKLKTKQNNASVTEFIKSVENETRRRDCRQLLELMRKVTGKRPKMWGSSMVGYGRYHYRYASGHEGDWFVTGFSPRKQDLTVYIMPGFTKYEKLLAKLGKHRTGKSCLYLKKLEDVDLKILEQIVERSVEDMARIYPD